MIDKKNSRGSWRFILALLPILAIATIAGAAFAPTTSVVTGRWVLSNAQGCPEGQVCTEWELTSGEHKDTPCCQDPSMVGSTDYHACEQGGGTFRQ